MYMKICFDVHEIGVMYTKLCFYVHEGWLIYINSRFMDVWYDLPIL